MAWRTSEREGKVYSAMLRELPKGTYEVIAVKDLGPDPKASGYKLTQYTIIGAPKFDPGKKKFNVTLSEPGIDAPFYKVGEIWGIHGGEGVIYGPAEVPYGK